jgi:hypothetical protein
MATPAQIAANRLNAAKSTGPSPAGLAVTRFNALKSGIDAHSQVIPGEDPAALDALAEDYRHQFQPATPEEVFLVDALTTADWELRRLRKIEPKLWSDDAFLEPDSKEAKRLVRFYRRLENVERSYFRALNELKKCAAARRRAAQEMEATAEAAEMQKLASFLHMPTPPPPGPAPARSENPANPKTEPKINLALRL